MIYPTDETLMQAVESGDKDAFEALYDGHAKMVFSFVYKTVGDRFRTEEIVQDLFHRLWHKKVHYDPSRSSLRTWLLVIARRIAIDYLRKANPTTQAGPIDDLYGILPGNKEHQPDKIAEVKEVQKLISTALAQLPSDQKMLVERMYFQGQTQQELADELEVPLGTIKSRLRLAMGKLRRSLVAERLEELL